MHFAFVMVKIDIALCVHKPTLITAKSTSDQELFYGKYDMASLMSLYAIRRIVSEHLLSGLIEIGDAKAFYVAVGKNIISLVSLRLETLCVS